MAFENRWTVFVQGLHYSSTALCLEETIQNKLETQMKSQTVSAMIGKLCVGIHFETCYFEFC